MQTTIRLSMILTLCAAVGSALSARAQSEPVGAAPPGFHGKIALDIRDSVPDWKPYTLKKAPEGAPNILFVLPSAPSVWYRDTVGR